MTTDTGDTRTEHIATRETPFHFVDSGLPNIYLIGITYYKYSSGRVVAEIPAIKQLMQLIARDLIEKPTALSGEEIRFLRKRLGQKQVVFAKAIGIEQETLSRAENGHQQLSESNDKLIRVIYIATSVDDEHLNDLRKELLKLLTGKWHNVTQAPPKKRVAKVTNDEWQLQAA